jgi:peptidyl-prolyl cis-trans isomerase B (cyclophilin B)
MTKAMAVTAALLASLSLMSCSRDAPGGDIANPSAPTRPSASGPSATGGSATGASGSGPTCQWIPVPPSGDVGKTGVPPVTGPATGNLVLTLNTNLGVVRIRIDRAKTPCTAASMEYLAGLGYYDSTTCHRLVSEISALQCGDPTGTGSGTAAYRFDDENLPLGLAPAYHEGDVAMANTGQPATNSSQFFFVYESSQLPGNYTLFGKVTEGLDIIKQVAAAGDDGAFAADAGGGHPLRPFAITTADAKPA